MNQTKKAFITAAFSLFTLFCAEAGTFSGKGAVKGDFYSNPKSGSFKPVLNLSGFFAGQMDFSNHLHVRSEFSLETGNIVGAGINNDIDAAFRLDEFSATYDFTFQGANHYLTFFAGDFEPAGSDLFIMRHFGCEGITSHFTESWTGLKGTFLFNSYGIGGDWSFKMPSIPVAAGLTLYKNNDNKDKDNQFNIDLRTAAVTRFFTIDAKGGIGIPVSSKNKEEDALLFINKIYAHCGIDLLIGNNYSQALFVQAGFASLPIKAGSLDNEIDSDDIYLLVEPRLYTEKFRAHLTLFSIPAVNTERLLFIGYKETLGANLCLYTDQLYIKNTDETFGINTSLTLRSRDFYDLKRFKDLIEDDYIIRVCPFVKIPVTGGEAMIMIQAKVNGFDKDNWKHHFKLNAGYKLTL